MIPYLKTACVRRLFKSILYKPDCETHAWLPTTNRPKLAHKRVFKLNNGEYDGLVLTIRPSNDIECSYHFRICVDSLVSQYPAP